MRPAKGMLFDMDGVLLMTTQSPDRSWQEVCHYFAPKLGLSPNLLQDVLQVSWRAYKQEIANDALKQRRDRLEPFTTRQETVQRALDQVGRGQSTVAAAMVHAYEALREQHRQLMPFAQETLQRLRAQGLPLALVSNGNATYQRQKLKQHHLASFFDAILIEEEFGIAKPDPQIFQAALDRLLIRAQEAWMIGDNLTVDIAAAQHVGMITLWFDPGKRGLPEPTAIHPDRILHTLPELFDLQREENAPI